MTAPEHGRSHPGDLPWADARRLAHASGRRLPSLVVRLDQALWQVTAEPILARTALPPMDTSAMDGWAVSGSGPWRVVGDVRAGTVSTTTLTPGEAVSIATGAAVPDGTDAILRQEDGQLAGGQLAGDVAAGTDIRPAGEECGAGTVLVEAGTPLGPIQLGLAAAGGHDEIVVVRRPRIAVLVLGDELLAQGPARAGRIRDSLGPQLPGWLERFGGEVVDARPVADRAEEHVAAVEHALAAADVVVTTGGTAAGPVDFVHRAIEQTGGRMVVDGVDCRPGHPMLLASWDDRWLVGLPGNPHAAIAALMTLGQPLLRSLRGTGLPTLARVRIGSRIGARGTGTRLVPCALVDAVAWPAEHIGSGMLRGLASADGLAVTSGQPSAGDLVGWLPLPASR